MTLIGLKRSLYTLAGMVFIVVAGFRVLLGQEAVSDVLFPAVIAIFLLVLLATVVARVEARIVEVEKKVCAREG